VSGLPAWLAPWLPADTARSWQAIATAVPRQAYLVGGTALTVHLRHRTSNDLDFFFEEPIDLAMVRTDLERLGPFAVTEHEEHTLNGQFHETKVQLLHAAKQTRLEPTTEIAGIQVAGLSDILAMKLKVIADRGELRDYFDVMRIEQDTGRTVEEGLGLYLARYGDRPDSNTLMSIVRGLGYLDDVLDDAQLPASRASIEAYWTRRQPHIVRNISREPMTPILPQAPTQPLSPSGQPAGPLHHGDESSS